MDFRSPLPSSGEETVRLQKSIIACDNDEAYYRLIVNEISQRFSNKDIQWNLFFKNALEQNTLTPRKIQEMSGISFRTVYNWYQKPPVKREHYVALSILFHLTVRETNTLLIRYGEFTSLVDSHLDDLVFIYMIEKALKDNNPSLFLEWGQIRDVFKRGMLACRNHSVEPYLRAREPYSIIIPRLDALCGVNESVKDIFRDWLGSIGQSLNQLVTERRLKPVYRRNYSRIDAEIPSRNFIIALALQIGMPIDALNNVLIKGKMEMLCPKDRMEGALVHILNMLYRQSPSYDRPEVMKSEMNIALQKALPGGSLPSYIYQRMHSRYIAPLIADTEEERDERICAFLFL